MARRDSGNKVLTEPVRAYRGRRGGGVCAMSGLQGQPTRGDWPACSSLNIANITAVMVIM